MTSTEELLRELIEEKKITTQLLKEKNESANSNLRNGMIIFILLVGSYLIGLFLIISFFNIF
ncbi:MAG: hypothetical protein M0R51_11470 [Clostridia bacterium]|jgi:hypothetical protein|nr:hypothetical protein [Clostridia bacterium]